MTKSRFESLGAFLPDTIQSTPELVAKMTNAPKFDLEDITGIKNRRVKGPGEAALQAAVSAAEECLSRSKYQPHEIDVVIVTSILRSINDEEKFYFEPSLSSYVKKKLGLTKAVHFDVSNACAGFFSGVHLVDSMIKSGTIKNGLVISGEYITCIADTAVNEITEAWDPQFGSLTVGDSGAAVVMDEAVDEHDKIDYVELMTCADYSELCIGMPSDATPSMALYTNNAEMHKKDRVKLWPVFQTNFLQKLGRTFESENFDYLIHHQVGTKAIHNFSKFGAEYFGVDKMPEHINCVENFGNTATTSHFLALYNHLKENGRLKKNQPPNDEPPRGVKILFVPAASGLITGCLSATISNLEV